MLLDVYDKYILTFPSTGCLRSETDEGNAVVVVVQDYKATRSPNSTLPARLPQPVTARIASLEPHLPSHASADHTIHPSVHNDIIISSGRLFFRYTFL